ncbi:secretion protein EspK [Mycobacterium sp. pR1184]|uniref:secretion protein EspK n=1 Tax=Mycobacterium sp. pR1184 TaxID=3238981 RepID=UPI00351BB1E6
MSIVRPTGRYAEQMLAPNGWPQVDEDALYDRAREYTGVMSGVTAVLEACQHEQISIFETGVWTGGAAGAADDELATRINDLTTLQRHLARVIAWHWDIAGSVGRAKSEIGDNVELAHRRINELEKDFRLEAAERDDAIETMVRATLAANVRVVSDTAEQIQAIKQGTSSANERRILLGQQALASDHDSPADVPDLPASSAPARVAPATLLPSASAAGVGPRSTPPPLPATTPAPEPVSPEAPDAAHASAIPAAAGRGPSAPDPQPAAVHASATLPSSHGGVRSKGVVSVRPWSGDSSAGPAADPGMPGMPLAAPAPMTPAAPGGAPRARSGSRAPAGQASPRKPSAVRPAAADKQSLRHRSAARAESANPSRASDGVAAPLVSVSLARAARDAIANATVGNAAGGTRTDALWMARHVAAALNAPVAVRTQDMGFFWVTAVTTDGEIVVANSYGLAYIPDGVQLPEKVHMASADEAIPAGERARWATYPVLAVQAWARHHDTELRAVIGTKEQLADSDPGVATILLTPEDIPDTGVMVGRTRLEVVDAEAADRLTATPDRELLDLIPAAQVGSPTAGQRATLWLAVMQPLASTLAGRQDAHLRAMHAYAGLTRDAQLHRAHNAADPVARRDAVADWLYWNHLVSRLGNTQAEAA